MHSRCKAQVEALAQMPSAEQAAEAERLRSRIAALEAELPALEARKDAEAAREAELHESILAEEREGAEKRLAEARAATQRATQALEAAQREAKAKVRRWRAQRLQGWGAHLPFLSSPPPLPPPSSDCGPGARP